MAEPRRLSGAEQGDLEGVRILVVESRFYEDISNELLKGATRALEAAGAAFDQVTVPGSLEIPPAITIALDAAEAAGKPYEAAVALGCVIRGDTIHFEIVSFESSRGIMEISRTRGVPIGNGILTVDNDAQARKRARPEEGDKGGEAARAALALVRLKRRLKAG
jgi:6,7-dimethyl-8-ribityllumazine synthase